MKFLITLCILISVVGYGQEKIPWSETKKLTWEDFKGKFMPQSDYVASTSSGIYFTYSYGTKHKKLKYKYIVTSYFHPEKSWYNPTQVSPYILKHEQTHFNISELHARMLRKEINEFSFTKNIKHEMDSLYNQIEIRRRAMQEKFDIETHHSKNKKKEKSWETYIDSQLKKYEPWSAPQS
jgi:hypothetical protein